MLGLGKLALMVVDLNSSPDIMVLAGTIKGSTS